jgi:hypothetical protein
VNVPRAVEAGRGAVVLAAVAVKMRADCRRSAVLVGVSSTERFLYDPRNGVPIPRSTPVPEKRQAPSRDSLEVAANCAPEAV